MAFSVSTDLQNVNITLRILFRPVANQLPQIYTNLGVDYDERVLPSIVNEVLKAVVVSILSAQSSMKYQHTCMLKFFPFFVQAQYDAGELITQRESVSQKISDELTNRASQFGLILDDISIVSIFGL